MQRGKHMTEAPPSRWRKRILGIPVAWWAAVTASGTALAVVGYIVLLGTSGTLTGAGAIDVVYGIGATATPVSGTPTCSATPTAKGDATATFSMSNAYPGDQCEFEFGFWNMSTDAAGRLQDFKLESPDFAGGAFTADLGADCGLSIAVASDPATGSPAVASVILTATETMTPGATYTLDPTVDGFQWVAQGVYDAAGGCNLP